MLVSRNALQTYAGLGKDSKLYFRTRQERNSYFGAGEIQTGQLCAIGGDPDSTDYTAAVWTMERFNGQNWAVVDIGPNFALYVTNEGLLALTNANEGGYNLKISRIAIKQTTPASASAETLSTWTSNEFFTSNGKKDICLDTNNAVGNPTFTLTNNLTYRTNLMNGGIQYTLLLDTDTMGQELEEATGPATLFTYKVSMIGLFVTNETEGEKLFAVANLPTPITKYATSPSQMGNALKFYLNLTLSNMGAINNLEVLESSVNSVPEVTTEDKLPEKYDGINSPYNLYLVDNLADTNVPAIAVRTGNPVIDAKLSWTYFTPTDDRLKITDAVKGTGIQNYMVVAWEDDTNKYVPADGSKADTQQLAGLYVGDHILYAGKIVNNRQNFTYSYLIDTIDAINYKIGDTVVADLPVVNSSDTVQFTIQILNVNNSGVPTEFYVTPTTGKDNVNTGNTYRGTSYPATALGEGTGLKINVTSQENSGISWEFTADMINKPLYAQIEGNAGKLSTTPTEMFVGWCVAHNAIKLALDLRNEASDVSYGTTRYATDEEVYSAATKVDAQLTTSVTPKRLQDNYIQKTAISGNKGYSADDPIVVDTHLKFTKQLVSTVSGVAFQGTAYRALWGDLAEYYRADKLYPAGTLVTVGDGHEEITIAKTECNGIISTKPGYELGNKESSFDLPLALIGKVPVLFAPDCLPRFGDRVYLSKNHPGKASNIPFGKCLGKIIDKRPNLDQVNSIMCSVRIAF